MFRVRCRGMDTSTDCPKRLGILLEVYAMQIEISIVRARDILFDLYFASVCRGGKRIT